jgi:predicted transposase YbfD/YdcC
LSKKTLAIIIESGNDYLVGVKANQPRLMNAIEQLAQEHIPLDIDEDYERTRDRLTHRKVQVFNDVTGIDPDWPNLQSLIRVKRWGTRSGKPFESTSYFISSLSCDASRFAQGIRGHRDIENRLHWVKDVVLIEDDAPFKVYNPATNWSIIRTIVLNLFRGWGYDSLTTGQRFLSHDVPKLFSLLTTN